MGKGSKRTLRTLRDQDQDILVLARRGAETLCYSVAQYRMFESSIPSDFGTEDEIDFWTIIQASFAQYQYSDRGIERGLLSPVGDRGRSVIHYVALELVSENACDDPFGIIESLSADGMLVYWHQCEIEKLLSEIEAQFENQKRGMFFQESP